MASPRFSVKIKYPNGNTSYLRHKDRSAWSKKTAQKYLDQWKAAHGTGHKVTAELEPAESYES